MSECTHDCSTCESKCEKADFLQPLNEASSVGKVIAVASGKGGVGKSLVTSMLACESVERGFKTAIMDADVTGPSIPKAFGLHEQALGTELGIE
ncbi:MAG: P-loop NTPase, partial [Clostridia bacterium]|nr:P-loop NTPase [Clostridia bacterium]